MNKFSRKSIRHKVHLTLILLGIVPYLLAIYIFVEKDMGVTQGVLSIAVIALLFHLTGFYILRRHSDELQRLTGHLETHVKTGEFRPLPELDHSSIELTNLTTHFNMLLNEIDRKEKHHSEIVSKLMKHARDDIRSYQQRLAEVDRLHDQIMPYVGSNIVDQMMSNGSIRALKNEKLMVTVLFADIRSFTTISEYLNPEEMISMLNEYFDAMVQVIHTYHGVLDKFIGDEIMAVFGLNAPLERSTLDAVNAAVAMRKTAGELMEVWHERGVPSFDIGIGLNTGEVIAGNLGSKNRMDYTVIGDTVNVAARIERLSKGNEILVGEETYKSCKTAVHMREVDRIKVKNRARPIKYYAIVDDGQQQADEGPSPA